MPTNLPIVPGATMPATITAPANGDPATATVGLLAADVADMAGALSGAANILYGKVTTDGAGGVTINGGAGFTASIVGTTIQIAITTARADAHYAIIPSVVMNSQGYAVQYSSQGAAVFRLQVHNINGVAQVSAATTVVTCHFVVIG